MNFNEYQELAAGSAFFTKGDKQFNLVYCTLGLNGETGEFTEHIKKMIRDDNNILTEERRAQMIKELGDILWYLSYISKELDIELEEIAKINIHKIYDRKKKGTERGSGDNR